MQLNLTPDEIKRFFDVVQVVEWDALTKEAQNDLLHLGVTSSDFNALMYELYDELTCY